MTYPGLVLLVGVGIGIATLLYYMFAENENEEPRQQFAANFVRNRRSSNHQDWEVLTPRLENVIEKRNLYRNKMREGTAHASRTEELRDYRSSREDINNCSICQYPLIDSVEQLRECNHKFHKDCIKQLRVFNPTAPCPNCRRIINHTI